MQSSEHGFGTSLCKQLKTALCILFLKEKSAKILEKENTLSLTPQIFWTIKLLTLDKTSLMNVLSAFDSSSTSALEPATKA